MRILSFVLLIALSYVSVSSATVETIESKICVQGGKPPSECPDNNKWNSVTCKFECLPHCVSNEGNFIFPSVNGTGFRQQCNSCNCRPDGTVGICTKMGCVSNVCYDDAGNKYQVGSTITRGCKTGTCTSSASGKLSWSWYSPASATTKPNCPYGPGIFNEDTCKWECPNTCQDGSTPRKCMGGLPPCSVVRCGANHECTDNHCPNYPNPNRRACTATCVSPVLCAKNPCQSPVGQPKCGVNQVCEADYRFGCGYQCKDIEEQPICAQGGPVPPECPNNNQWNDVTCQFECVCPQNINCGINGAWDYDRCTCVVNSPAPVCTKPQEPQCDLGSAVFDEATCKWSCPKTCADGSQPVNCLVNPCAATLCLTNTECVANYCGGCGATCQTIKPIVNCLVAPCSVNSCGNGQTCVDDYHGGCNYRCI